MTKNQSFEDAKRKSEKKWMSNARQTAVRFIKPVPPTDRIQYDRSAQYADSERKMGSREKPGG